MTEIFVLEPVAVDEHGRRVPDDLPIEAPERDKLETALRESGYAIVSIDADAAPPASARGATDTKQLRAAVEALVNEADDSEVVSCTSHRGQRGSAEALGRAGGTAASRARV